MGLFSKIKKGFKKIFKGVKKVIKKVVKGVKKVVKKISSSKILKALAIAAAVIVTGGAAISAFTGGAGLAASTTGSTFANWMMTTSSNVLAGTGISGIKASTKLGKFAQGAAKVVAKPFGAIGTTAGNLAAGVTDFTGLTTESSRIGITPEMQTAIDTAQVQAGVSGTGPTTFAGQNQAALDAAKAAGANTKTLTALETMNVASVAPPKTSFWETYTGKALKYAGQTVGGTLLQGATAQYIAGDKSTQGSMAGGAYEGGEYMDRLQVYAAENNINTDDIYSHMMYGNSDPSSQYGNDLYRQQTFGVA